MAQLSAAVPTETDSGPTTRQARRWALADAVSVLPGMAPFGAMLGVTVITTGERVELVE